MKLLLGWHKGGKMTVIETIERVIAEQLRKNHKKYIIYPYGIAGYAVRRVLQEKFGIEPICAVDDGKAGVYPYIKNKEYLYGLEDMDVTILLATKNPKAVAEIQKTLEPYQIKYNIVNVFPLEVGKHTIGDSILTNNTGYMIERIGAFCSFADGCSVVGNHDLKGVSTHSIFQGFDLEDVPVFHDIVKDIPLSRVINLERCVIGNDVWLGRNVTICNGAKIGDGVIAAAGAVIVRDVPNYAIVGGIPARTIKYRYSEKQVELLNQIKWWEWPDEKIVEHFQEFSDINIFLEKAVEYVKPAV